jgi:hypothetical protein
VKTVRRALIVVAAGLTLLLGVSFGWLTSTSAPLLSLLGVGTTIVLLALAARQFVRLG